MSLPVVLMPDAEQVVTTVLAARLDPSVTVCTIWPDDVAAHLPVVSVSRGGGATYLRFVMDEPTIDIDVLAGTKAAAADLAAVVRAQMFAAEGSVAAGGLIYRMRDISLIWLPDPLTNVARYVLVMQIRLRPQPA